MLLHRRLRHRWEFYNGNFEALRKAAVDEEKYCLVNIQSRLEFSLLMLNRDTWSDDSVRVLVGHGFLFWQQEHDSEGDDFTEIDLYDFTTYDVPSGEVVDEGSQEIGP